MGITRTRREKSTRRQSPLAQLLIPHDGAQHPLLDSRMGYPHIVDNFRLRCDCGHSNMSFSGDGVSDGCWARWTARGSAVANKPESCPQLLSTGGASMPIKYQPRGRVAASACMSARTWRRTRLRTTAGPIRRGVENATCTPVVELSGTIRTVKMPSRIGRMP